MTSRFPVVTETFILRELIELERQGADVVLVPLLRGSVSTLHPEAVPWERRALYTPFLSGPILLSNLKVFLTAPLLYLATFCTLLWEARANWNALTGTLGVFPKSVHNGQRIRALGVRHIHAHFATHPAVAAYIMSRVHRPAQSDIPYSLTVHAHDIFVPHARLPRRLAAAAFVRCISQFNVEYLLERFGPGKGPLTRELFRVIHCGIEPDLYSHRPPPGVPGVDRPVEILCVAAMRPYKGLTHLIEAVRLTRAGGLDVHCTVIGEGTLRGELERQVQVSGLGGHVDLAGTKTQAEVAQALETADFFMLPSVVAPDGQMEGIPVVLMEALAAALPTISTRLSGIPELVIHEQTGLLVEPERPDQLAHALRRALEDYERVKEWAASGARLVRRKFEVRENVRRLLTEIQAFL